VLSSRTMTFSSVRFDTRQLKPLRSILSRFAASNLQLANLFQLEIVVDANAIIGDLIYKVRHPERGATALEELIAATVVVAHAPRWLDTDMASAIPKVAARRKVSEKLLWERWLEYRSLLVWDETLVNPAATCGNCCDPKDVPYVQLYRKRNAMGVLSNDAHIGQLGGHALPHEFVRRARDYARAVTPVISIRVAGVVVPVLTAAVLVESLRGLIRLWLRIPDQAKALIVFGAIIALLHPNSRKWLADVCQRGGETLGVAVEVISGVVSDMASLHAESLKAAESNLALALAFTQQPESRRLPEGTGGVPVRRRRRRVASTRQRIAAVSK
jgi:hypothetical protein